MVSGDETQGSTKGAALGCAVSQPLELPLTYARAPPSVFSLGDQQNRVRSFASEPLTFPLWNSLDPGAIRRPHRGAAGIIKCTARWAFFSPRRRL